MGKLDDLMRAGGANLAGSLGLGQAPAAAPPGMSAAEAQRLPARLQGVAKSKNAVEIAVDKIQRDDNQPREEFDEASLSRLADSLRSRGQLQPVRVRWDEIRSTYVIIAGERRWRAAVKAGLATLSCVIHEGPIDPAEQLALQVVENALREDLRPVEQARAYKKLMALNGWSGNQLAKELAVDQSAVSRSLALLDLPAEVQAKVDAGKLAARAASEIARLADPAEQVALAEQAVAGVLTGGQVAATVKARKLGRAKAEPPAKVEFRFDDSGKVVVTLPPGLAGAAAVVEMLQRALKKAKAEMKAASPMGEGRGEAAESSTAA
jgi:ParB family chromosome partitioning protein